jgi:hypothetical protein
VREQRVVLENRVDVAVERGLGGDVLAGEVDRPSGDLFESRDESQHRCLARTRRPQHREELAVGDVEIDSVNGFHVPEVLAQTTQRDRGARWRGYARR